MFSKIFKSAGIYFCLAYFLVGSLTFVLGDAPQVFNDPALNEAAQKTQRRDTWGFFEFLHYHTEAAKQKEALSVIHDQICSGLEKAGDNVINGWNKDSMFTVKDVILVKQADLVYGDSKLIPTDVYREAIQQVEDQDLGRINQKYPKLEWLIYPFLMGFYDQGKGPATKTVASVEKYKLGMANAETATKEMRQKLMGQNKSFSGAPSAPAGGATASSNKPKKSHHAAKAPANEQADGLPALANDASQAPATNQAATPQTKKEDVVGKAVGNAAGDVAKKLFNF